MVGVAATAGLKEGGSARYVILVLASLQLLMSSGLVLGWMGFVLIFRGEGTFAADCTAEERGSGACDASENLALTTIYTVGLSVAAMAPLPLGLVIDRCASPRLVGVVFAAGTALGFLVLAVSDSQGVIAIGFALFSFFGSGVQLNLFHVASLFPDGKGLVMGWFTTLFGFSALLPMVLFYIWEWLDSPEDARRTLFLWFSAVLCIFVAFSATMGVKFGEGDRVRWGCRGFELIPSENLPPGRSKSAEPAVESTPHLGEAGNAVHDGVDGGAHSTCSNQACSVDYKVFLIFFSMHFFRSLFYLGAVDLQIASIAGSTVRSSCRLSCLWFPRMATTAPLFSCPEMCCNRMPRNEINLWLSMGGSSHLERWLVRRLVTSYTGMAHSWLVIPSGSFSLPSGSTMYQLFAVGAVVVGVQMTALQSLRRLWSPRQRCTAWQLSPESFGCSQLRTLGLLWQRRASLR